MSSRPVVLVTGVTGKTGSAVARALLARGHRVRGASRRLDRTRVPDDLRAQPGFELVAADLTTGAGLVEALAGVEAVHHAAPNLSADEVGMLVRLGEAMGRAGVRRVVYHSVMHPWAPTMPHHVRKAEAEAWLHTTDLDWTILQPAAYHQNLAGGARRGRLAVPYSLEARFTTVDLADVGEAVAEVVARDLVHATLELAGPETLTVQEMADRAAAALGHPVTAERVPPPEGDDRETRELRAMFDHYDRFGFTGSAFTLRALLGREPTTWAASTTTKDDR